MRRTFCVAVLPGLVLGGLWACKGGRGPGDGALDPANSPVIACPQAEYDFGTVTQGEEIKHTFTIQNTGRGTLQIERAQGS